MDLLQHLTLYHQFVVAAGPLRQERPGVLPVRLRPPRWLVRLILGDLGPEEAGFQFFETRLFALGLKPTLDLLLPQEVPLVELL